MRKTNKQLTRLAQGIKAGGTMPNKNNETVKVLERIKRKINEEWAESDDSWRKTIGTDAPHSHAYFLGLTIAYGRYLKRLDAEITRQKGTK